jgi:hypothetical protein
MENFGYVMATKMLVVNKRKVRFMYRERPSNKQDSGWRFFCGDEDQNYTNNPDNIAIYDIDTIIALDKSIIPYLKSEKGTAFEREDENGMFAISKDFAFGKEGK